MFQVSFGGARRQNPDNFMSSFVRPSVVTPVGEQSGGERGFVAHSRYFHVFSRRGGGGEESESWVDTKP